MTLAAPGRRVPTEDDLSLLARLLKQHGVNTCSLAALQWRCTAFHE